MGEAVMSNSVVVVYNKKSGSATDPSELKAIVEETGSTVKKMLKIDTKLHKNLRPYVRAGATIMAVGGDGTVSAVANLVADTNAVLVPIPSGTLNNFTKDLGIPQDISDAIRHCIKAKERAIDIAKMNDQYFINNSSIGIYPQSLRIRERTSRTVGKWPAALLGIVKALVHFRTYSVTIDKETFQTPFIFVGNNDYHLEDFDGSGRQRIDEGKLSIYIIKSTKRFDLIRTLLSVLLGRAQTLDSFDYRKASAIRISSKKHRRVSVSHDGEVSRVTLPITYSIQPRDLRIRY